MQGEYKKPAWGEGFTTIGHAVLNNSINFKNRLQKPAYLLWQCSLDIHYCPSVFYQISYNYLQ